MRREALAEEDDHEGAASVKEEGDTEMVDAPQYGESISGFRRASSVSAAAHSSASAPPSSTSSSSTLKRASLANIVHDMDVTPSATTHEVIEVASDSEDDSEDEEEGEPHEGGEPEEAEPEAEQEEDEEEDESSEDSEEEDSEDETDVPTATQAPIPPTPPPKISISNLTTTDVAPVAAAATEAPAQASTSTAEAAALGVEAAGSAAPAKKKPVSKRKRTPSPSPPPIAPPPPFTTIRLEIKLGGFERYTVDIHQLAKDTGQRPASPPPLHVADPVVVEEEPEETGGKKKKRKKKSAAQEYYDTNDPFIDDSELAIDQRTHVAQTKQEGFYVSAGEVALLKDLSSPKKPKSTKKGLAATLHSTVNQAVSAAALKRDKSNTNGAERDGSPSDDPAQRALGMSNGLKGVGITNGQNQPGDPQGKGPSTGGGWTSNVADDEGEEKTGQKRKRYITVIEGGKKRKIVNINSFHPELQAAIEDLKKEIAKENWEQKGKFPPALKPHLSSLALLAIKLDEYDDHFFNLMPTLFPYNKFTMTKLIKRTVYPEHVALLQQRQDELLHELEDLSKAGFAKAEEEWQRSVTLWDKRQEKARAENAGASTDANGSISAAPSRHPSTEDKDGMDVDQPTPSISAPPGTQAANNPNAHPPAKKFRLTEQMKAIIWDLVLLSNECCRLENEKNGYEQSVIQVSEQGLRKVLYQKIVAAFPDGWMSSGQISRDVSAMKKRLEKEALEND